MKENEPNPGLERGRYELRATGLKPDSANPLRAGVHSRGYLPHQVLSEILKSWKQFTSRRAKPMVGLVEGDFWQRESYDHWIRNDEEKARIRRYVRNNPATAGLCAAPEDWRWSSAWQGRKEECATQRAS